MSREKNTSDALAVPELLAPAGSPACALAACDAGADAIYAGLPRFNARERGENFTVESMTQIVDYFHANRKKVYITVNTLIKETELPALMETLAAVNEIAPDAILVQDPGVLRIARTYFPALELHASTQMGFHNSAGLQIAAEMGCKRVVLERQLTIEELQSMEVPAGLELECFIHGALCCSLSGSCFFSSWLGGASGNRGKCKQPCRRRYFSKNGNGFFFSPGDLNGIEVINDLRKLGVVSYKIEGRLRQPDYVTNAVSAYRMLLDAATDEEFRESIGEARNLLSRTCGRLWTSGFYPGRPAFEKLIRPDAVGAAGLRCGEVEAIGERGFGFTAAKRLHLGDRLRIQPRSGEEGPALTMTRIFVENRPAKLALPGQRVFVCCDKEVPDRGTIFKIGESSQDYTARLAALPQRRPAVDLEIALQADKIEIKVKNTAIPAWSKPLALTPAEKHPAAAETLIEAFSATGSKEFRLGKCDCRINGKYFLPAQILKSLRREFWQYAAGEMDPAALSSSAADESAAALTRFYFDYKDQQRYLPPEYLPETVAIKAGGDTPGDRRARRARSVYEVDRSTDEAILPDFAPEGTMSSLRKAVERAYQSGIRRFRVTSLYGIILVREIQNKYPEDEIIMVSGTPLPAANSLAVAELRSLGIVQAMAHVELEREALEALRDHSVLPLELYRFGRPALLTTRAKVPVEGAIKDSRGNGFEIRKGKDNLYRLYPAQVMSVPRVPGFHDFYDLTNANWRNSDTALFNFENSLN